MKNRKYIFYVTTIRKDVYKKELINILSNFHDHIYTQEKEYVFQFSIWFINYSTIFNYVYDHTVNKSYYSSYENYEFLEIPLNYKFKFQDKNIECAINQYLNNVIEHNKFVKLMKKV